MASDQLFRKQFIDPKMPGFMPNHEELDLCKSVVGRLRVAVDGTKAAASASVPAAKKRAAGR